MCGISSSSQEDAEGQMVLKAKNETEVVSLLGDD